MIHGIRGLVATAGLALTFGMASTANAIVLAEWNFNQSTAAAQVVATDGVFQATSTLAPIGGITVSAPSTGSGSSDPTAGTNNAYQTSGYPTTSASNKTAGIQVNASSVGYENVTFEVDLRGSNTASRNFRIQYTLNRTAVTPVWVDGTAIVLNSATFFNNNVLDLSGVPAADNNPNLAFRVVSELAPTGAYQAISGSYSSNGTIRFDMVQVQGTVIPEPGTIAAVATGLIGLVGIRRRK